MPSKMKIEITSRDRKFKFYADRRKFTTVEDIKKYLSDKFKVDIKNFTIYNKEDILEDSTNLFMHNFVNLDYCINNLQNSKTKKVHELIDDNITINEIDDQCKVGVNKENDEYLGIELPDKDTANIVCNEGKCSTLLSIDGTASNEYIAVNNVWDNTCDTISDDTSDNSVTLEYKSNINNRSSKTVKVKLRGTSTVILADSSELYTKANQTYLMRSQMKLDNKDTILRKIQSLRIKKEDLLKILVVCFLIVTDNSEILFILSVIFFLQFASKMFVKHNRKFSTSLNAHCRTLMLFLASIFMIDHANF